MQPDHEQIEAITAPCGHVLVVSPPGSGKTTVLTERVRYLISGGVHASSIFCTTFSRRAADELRSRLSDLPCSGDLQIGTLHSTCHRILKAESTALEAFGYRQGWSIASEADQQNLIRQIIRKNNVQRDSEEVLRLISKNKLTLRRSEDETISYMQLQYDQRLVEMNLMDMDDLILNTVRLMLTHEDIVRWYAWRIQHILIDEVQDTDPCQWQLLKLLSSANNSIYACGDLDQAIYGYRGADPGILVEYAEDPETTVYRLTRNYRSTSGIVSASTSLIRHNTKRIPINQVAMRDNGTSVSFYVGLSESDEANHIVNKIREHICEGVDPGQIAVLVRARHQLAPIRHAMAAAGIPLHKVRHAKAINDAVCKTVIAFMRYSINEKDLNSFAKAARIIRGISEDTIASVCHTKQLSRRVIMATDTSSEEGLGLQTFLHVVDAIRPLSPTEAIEFIIHHPMIELPQNNSLEKLSALAAEAERGMLDPSIDSFIQLVRYLEMVPATCGTIKLLTIHASKGQEFEVVFIPGIEEQIIPSSHCSTDDEIEEERRLLYVAMTRAREVLHLSIALKRHSSMESSYTRPSRFLSEIDCNEIPPIIASGWMSKRLYTPK